MDYTKDFDPQTACAFTQFGTLEETKSPLGWADELDTYIEMAQFFEEFHKLRAKYLKVKFEGEYWGIVCEWSDELEIFWDMHKESFFKKDF